MVVTAAIVFHWPLACSAMVATVWCDELRSNSNPNPPDCTWCWLWDESVERQNRRKWLTPSEWRPVCRLHANNSSPECHTVWVSSRNLHFLVTEMSTILALVFYDLPPSIDDVDRSVFFNSVAPTLKMTVATVSRCPRPTWRASRPTPYLVACKSHVAFQPHAIAIN